MTSEFTRRQIATSILSAAAGTVGGAFAGHFAATSDASSTKITLAAVARSTRDKLLEGVSVADYRRLRDPDDTLSFTRAFANSTHVLVPERASPYVTGQIVVPSTVKHIYTRGRPLIIPAGNTFFAATRFRNEWDPAVAYAVGDAVQFIATAATVAAELSPNGLMYRSIQAGTGETPSTQSAYWAPLVYTSFIQFDGQSDLLVDGLGVSVDPQIYPHVRCIDFSGVTSGLANDLYVPKAGAIGVYAGNCRNLTLADPDIGTFAWHGISFEGPAQDTVVLRGGSIKTFGIGTGSCVNAQLGARVSVQGGFRGEGARTFGVGILNVDGPSVLGCFFRNTRREAVACLGGSAPKVQGNDARWDAGVSQDFGYTLDGLGGFITDADYSRNFVFGAGKSGFCVTAATNGGIYRSRVIENTVLDCNTTGDTTQIGAAVILSGTNVQYNEINRNILWDTRVTPLHRYGVLEADLGNGLPSNNTIDGTIALGFVVDDVRPGSNSTRVRDRAEKLYTPSISASSGRGPAASTAGRWRRDGVYNEVACEVAITSSAAGSGAILVSLPEAAKSGSNYSSGFGYEATSGRALTVYAAGKYVYLKFADGTYPGANGNVLEFRARYLRA